jgi:type IV pilus assembly protein PilA
MTKISRLAEVARRRARGEEEGAEQGFTLIELLVVLLIIGILLAIAIPTFLSVTKAANDTAAQANLQTTLTGAKTWFTQNNQTYTGVNFKSVDINVSTVAGKTSSDSVVSYATSADGGTIGLEAWSATNVCWGIVDTTTGNNPGTTYFAVTNVTSTTGCTAAASVPAGAKTSTNGFGSITGVP